MSSQQTAGTPAAASPHKHQVWPYRRSPALRYGVAVAAVLAAFTIRYMIYGDFQNRLVFTFFLPAAVIAVWYGGIGPGIAATVLGLLLRDYFFMMSRKGLLPLRNPEALAVGVSVVTTLLCVGLC